ncbi:MAG TPA: sigma-70 family RNA polymerase sigma factor, partial [Tepidisphaeraceae bacterium]
MPDFAVISDHDLLCHCHGETDGGAAHAAFGELARRHVDFVYGVARRQVRDPHLAADVTQTVLLVLARKAAAVRSPQQLPGWLFQTTRYAAANALRQQARRARHERAAATLRHEAARPVGGLLTDLEAPLNDALARLPANERDAILLRFFKDTDYADLAQKLSITESAARKRVSRGVERLRAELSRHLPAGAGGVAPAAVVGLLTAAAAEKAPAALVATAAAATPAAALIGKGTLMALAVSPLKAAAAALAALVIAALVGGGIYSFAKRPSAAAPVGPATQTAQVAWLTNAATHRFADGTVAGVLVVGDMMTGQWWHADGTPAHMPALATPQLVRDGAVIKLRPDKRYIGVATTAVRGESNLYYVTSLTSGERALTPTIFSDGGSEMPCYVNV